MVHWVLYASNESSNFTSETNDVRMVTNIIKKKKKKKEICLIIEKRNIDINKLWLV